jgi:putative addiction module component (TIGR02574 family)
MTQHARQILEDALTLPEEERIGIANDLLESVEGTGGPGWEEAWAAEIDQRLERYRQGLDKGIPWSEVRERIEKRIGRK